MGDYGAWYSTVSVNLLGFTPDPRLIGDQSGLSDVSGRVIQTLNPVGTLDPDTVLRCLLMKADLNFSLSPVIESAIRGVREFIELLNHELDLESSMGFDRPQPIKE